MGPDELSSVLPSFLPDVHTVREDVCDYLGECHAVDEGLGVLLAELEARGELENCMVVVSETVPVVRRSFLRMRQVRPLCNHRPRTLWPVQHPPSSSNIESCT